MFLSISRAFSLFWAERAFPSSLIWVGSFPGTCIWSSFSFCVSLGLLSSVHVGSSSSAMGSSGPGFCAWSGGIGFTLGSWVICLSVGGRLAGGVSSVPTLNPFSGSLLGS